MAKTILGRIIAGFLTFIKNLIKGVSKEARDLIPVAIAIVNAIKNAIENPITGNLIDFILDAVKKAIPGTVDDVLIDKIKALLIKWLPIILDRLKAAQDIVNIVDENERMLAILKAIQPKDKTEKSFLYNDWACLFAVELTDESLPLSKALITVPAIYQMPELLTA